MDEGSISKFLHEIRPGRPNARDRLFDRIYSKLRALARARVTHADAKKRYLFPTTPGPCRAKNFARETLKMLKRLSKSTGISVQKLTSQNFRRYFVSQCADCGIDILCVMQWVGHADWEMVRRYYRLRDDHAQEAMGKFSTGPSRDALTAQNAPIKILGEHVGKNSDEKTKTSRRRRRQRTPAA